MSECKFCLPQKSMTKNSYFGCCMYLLIDGCASVLFLLMLLYIDALLLELS